MIRRSKRIHFGGAWGGGGGGGGGVGGWQKTTPLTSNIRTFIEVNVTELCDFPLNVSDNKLV